MEQKTKEEINEILKQIIEKYGTDRIEITWDGGNDEGSYNLTIGDAEIDFYSKPRGPEYEFIDYFADQLGYYGFAGDFYCSGSVSYYPAKNALIGEDSYEEAKEHTYVFKNPIIVKIPKDLWFDSVEVDAEGYDDYANVGVRLTIKDGPVSEYHVAFEDTSEKYIENEIHNTLFKENYEIRDLWLNFDQTNKNDLPVDKDGNSLIVIKEASFTQYETEDKEIVIQF